jgi:uncharacterized membrane-anchored protein
MMNTKQHIDDLFSGYEDSSALADFKEELQSNLNERIKTLIKKGLDENAAYEKAVSELGDVSAVAEELSLKKKREVYEEMYMKTKNYMDKWHIAGYPLAGGLLVMGIIFSLLAYFASGDIISGLGALIVFFIVPVCAFVFLGLTQETAKNNPMSRKRALLYVAAVAVMLFGIVVFTMTFFAEHNINQALASLGSLVPFFLPGSVALAFLILTEKSRRKPWVIEQEAAWTQRMKEQFADPYITMRFGLFSGALWLFAIALFVVLGFLIGFQYSWAVFLFAIAAQVLVQALMIPGNKKIIKE